MKRPHHDCFLPEGGSSCTHCHASKRGCYWLWEDGQPLKTRKGRVFASRTKHGDDDDAQGEDDEDTVADDAPFEYPNVQAPTVPVGGLLNGVETLMYAIRRNRVLETNPVLRGALTAYETSAAQAFFSLQSLLEALRTLPSSTSEFPIADAGLPGYTTMEAPFEALIASAAASVAAPAVGRVAESREMPDDKASDEEELEDDEWTGAPKNAEDAMDEDVAPSVKSPSRGRTPASSHADLAPANAD